MTLQKFMYSQIQTCTKIAGFHPPHGCQPIFTSQVSQTLNSILKILAENGTTNSKSLKTFPSPASTHIRCSSRRVHPAPYASPRISCLHSAVTHRAVKNPISHENVAVVFFYQRQTEIREAARVVGVGEAGIAA
jgi:hypothetical protein